MGDSARSEAFSRARPGLVQRRWKRFEQSVSCISGQTCPSCRCSDARRDLPGRTVALQPAGCAQRPAAAEDPAPGPASAGRQEAAAEPRRSPPAPPPTGDPRLPSLTALRRRALGSHHGLGANQRCQPCPGTRGNLPASPQRVVRGWEDHPSTPRMEIPDRHPRVVSSLAWAEVSGLLFPSHYAMSASLVCTLRCGGHRPWRWAGDNPSCSPVPLLPCHPPSSARPPQVPPGADGHSGNLLLARGVQGLQLTPYTRCH